MNGASHAAFPATPLVGRERELATLRAHLDAALAGRGSLVLIGGEAGIGKTALAEALLAEARRARRAGAGRALLRPQRDAALRPLARALRAGPRRRRPARLAVALLAAERGGETLASQAAIFAARARRTSPRSPRGSPLVLLLEDLHWADPASLDLLRAVARQLADLPLLLLATYRDDELAATRIRSPAPARAGARGPRRAPRPAPLSATAIAALVARALPPSAGRRGAPGRAICTRAPRATPSSWASCCAPLEEAGRCARPRRRGLGAGRPRGGARAAAAAPDHRRAGGAAGRGDGAAAGGGGGHRPGGAAGPLGGGRARRTRRRCSTRSSGRSRRACWRRRPTARGCASPTR